MTETAESDQVYAVLVQIMTDTLLMPNLAVADVVPNAGLKQISGCPPWFAGELSWQGRRVPVARFEVANGASESVPPGKRTRLLIVNATGNDLESGAFAIVIEGNPHLVTLNRVALQSAALRDTDNDRFVAARARIANQEATIPNFPQLEQELAAILDGRAN